MMQHCGEDIMMPQSDCKLVNGSGRWRDSSYWYPEISLYHSHTLHGCGIEDMMSSSQRLPVCVTLSYAAFT